MKTFNEPDRANRLHVKRERLALYRALFVGRTDAYVIWNNGKIRAVQESLDNDVLKAHLAGEFRVGSYLIGEDGRTPYLVFDIDKRDRGIVKKIVRRLQNRGIPQYVERSKSKGFHIWVFFVGRVRAKTARKLARLILKGLEQEKIEVFPKQDAVPKGGFGNCIWLPFFPPDVERNRTVFVNGDFLPVPKRWSFLRTIKRVSKKIVVKLAKKVTGTEPKRTRVKLRQSRILELAPCAQAILLRGVAKHHRNVSLFTLAKHLRNAGLTKDYVLDLTTSANERCRPPLKENDVSEIVKSVFDKKYTSLGCEDSFIASLCGDKCPIKRKRNSNVSTTADEVIDRAEEKPILHPAQAFQAGILWYGQKVGRECLWVNSERKAFTLAQMRKEFTVRLLPLKSQWSLKSIKAFTKKRKKLRPDVLFINLRSFISLRIRFLASWQATVVTLWVMGTYVHRIFEWYGYLWLTSPGRRAGKSRLLEIISALSYNATPVMTDPTEASLFRETASNASTQVLDEVESLRGSDQEKRAAMMSVLNVGFKAGSKVPRFNNNKNQIEYHDTFCPRVLAGISRLAPTLADRCVRIFLRRKLKTEKIKRFSERKLSKYLQVKRDNLHIFGLLHAPAIAKKYSTADSLAIPKEVDDRARDILEPLFAIAAVLDEGNDSLKVTKQLIHAAEQIAKDRANDEGEDEVIVATLEVLIQKFPAKKDCWVLSSSEAMEILSKHEVLEWVQHRKHATRLLRQLGFRSGTHRNDWGKVVRAYSILKRKLDDLCARYGVTVPKTRS